MPPQQGVIIGPIKLEKINYLYSLLLLFLFHPLLCLNSLLIVLPSYLCIRSSNPSTTTCLIQLNKSLQDGLAICIAELHFLILILHHAMQSTTDISFPFWFRHHLSAALYSCVFIFPFYLDAKLILHISKENIQRTRKLVQHPCYPSFDPVTLPPKVLAITTTRNVPTQHIPKSEGNLMLISFHNHWSLI
jgi:hypothetical protein